MDLRFRHSRRWKLVSLRIRPADRCRSGLTRCRSACGGGPAVREEGSQVVGRAVGQAGEDVAEGGEGIVSVAFAGLRDRVHVPVQILVAVVPKLWL